MTPKLKVLMITDGFPFGGGEQFIIPEIEGWNDDARFEVTLAPLSTIGSARELPQGIGLVRDISPSQLSKIRIFLGAVFGLRFFLNLKLLLKSLSAERSVRGKLSILKRFFIGVWVSIRLDDVQRRHSFDCIYCYWANNGPLALLFSSGIGQDTLRIARAHGYDLYEERSQLGYVPFKSESLNVLDELHCISEEGASYAQTQYRIPSDKVYVSRLGVQISETLSHPPCPDRFAIVSCSFVSKIKRVDKIIDALSIAALNINWPITWTHIGSGEMFDEIKEYAKTKLANTKVEFKFVGQLDNNDVHALYESDCFDCFVNFSEHEGVPVSIMEAMARGIPAIAPDVGGVATLFGESNWRLMPTNAGPNEMADRLTQIAQLSSSEQRDLRSEVYALAKTQFSAAVNHRNFRDHVFSEISRCRQSSSMGFQPHGENA